ncbi:MAG: UDP-N-acetylmuramate dehydrogenase [Bacteroidaceae bacterium]|nr:UDP-N-acetylmuramate dehydrogenase [Bacteroidaceae bacterium]
MDRMFRRIQNTFGIDVQADRVLEYRTEAELRTIVPMLSGESVLHVGAGSNLLFTRDFKGTVLHSGIRLVEPVQEDVNHVWVKVGAGIVWDDFVAYTVARGWSGAENLSLIPGEVGASAVQNIGAYGVEAKDLIEWVDCISLTDGSSRRFSVGECQYGYRTSIFKTDLKGQYAVTYVTYRLTKQFVPHLDYGNLRSLLADKPELKAADVRRAIIDIRRAKLPDPKQLGNAGSFFMNPVVSRMKFDDLNALYPQMPHYEVENGVKIPAGWLIEQCGWKGRSLGQAGVYEKQALILVNHGGATGADILRLCHTIQHDVAERFDIIIQPEVNIL